MSDQMLTLLKFGVLTLLYIFFAWALWAVWSEIRNWKEGSVTSAEGGRAPRADVARPAKADGASPSPVREEALREEAPPAPALSGAVAGAAAGGSGASASSSDWAPPNAADEVQGSPPNVKELPPGALLVVAPEEQAGRQYSLGKELTIGRAPGCGVSIDDTFVSQLHARVYAAENAWMVEDLGSTNGTIVNGKQLEQTTVIRQGDQIQLGSTVLELR